MTREQAYNLMLEMLQSRNLQKHGLAVEAIMKALCRYLEQRHPDLPKEEFNEEEWGIVGLLHDADYELVQKDSSRHTLVTAEKLRLLNASERIINGIMAHHDGIKETRDNLMEKSVYAADELSGLITAAALIIPDKKLSSLSNDSVMKRFREKKFAAGAKREKIFACEGELNIPLEDFIAISLKAMQTIAEDLGL